VQSQQGDTNVRRTALRAAADWTCVWFRALLISRASTASSTSRPSGGACCLCSWTLEERDPTRRVLGQPVAMAPLLDQLWSERQEFLVPHQGALPVFRFLADVCTRFACSLAEHGTDNVDRPVGCSGCFARKVRFALVLFGRFPQ
jgi:hypothetical protein